MTASLAWGQQPASGDRDFQQAAEDAWIDGRLEGTYIFNDHLSAAAIDTEVRNGIVTLTGTVESDIDRDLAGEIAKGLKGVASVENRLRVAGESPAAHADVDRDVAANERRSFGQSVNDATTSAAVKAGLISNKNIRARDINVDTEDDVVTLSRRRRLGAGETTRRAAREEHARREASPQRATSRRWLVPAAVGRVEPRRAADPSLTSESGIERVAEIWALCGPSDPRYEWVALAAASRAQMNHVAPRSAIHASPRYPIVPPKDPWRNNSGLLESASLYSRFICMSQTHAV